MQAHSGIRPSILNGRAFRMPNKDDGRAFMIFRMVRGPERVLTGYPERVLTAILNIANARPFRIFRIS